MNQLLWFRWVLAELQYNIRFLVDFMENSDEESITSGSEYCPSTDDDSDDDEYKSESNQQTIYPFYNNFQDVMKVKRKIFSDMAEQKKSHRRK